MIKSIPSISCYSLQLALSIFITIFVCTTAFKWPVKNNLELGMPLRISEGYMFGTNSGPLFMDKGKSYISMDFNLQT